MPRAFDKAEDGVHYCEERFLEVARRHGVLGLPQQRVTLEEALATHSAHVRMVPVCPLQQPCRSRAGWPASDWHRGY